MKQYLLALLCLGILSSAGEQLAIAQVNNQLNNTTLQTVEKRLQRKRADFPNGGVFDILTPKYMSSLSAEEQELVRFLYAYMPSNDLVDHTPEYFIEQVRLALSARKTMPWGKQIPEREFKHFVLPPRVNNEDLDSARRVFYHELRDRVRGLSLYEAVLEVNHWCHEHVVYAPSDARTSSPLATIRSAYGRCGEESTLLVSALRAVGIPARQVYTPRWAHTDDNHAWVEAWVDGKWMFLGACEPEPVLNLGWFNAPASRAMLVHTKVFGGDYDGPEEVMSQNANYTEINVIGNYAQSSPLRVRVVDATNKIIPGAEVEFKLYNYGEFYTIARKTSSAKGLVSLTAGHGDMLLWGSYKPNPEAEPRFGFRKVSFGRDREVTLRLDMSSAESIETNLTIIPPREKAIYPKVTPEMRAENDRRMSQEDSIRSAYVASFISEQIPGLDARGNWHTLRMFLDTAQDKIKAKQLLEVISAKDRRDVTLETLRDHLEFTSVDATLLKQYPDVVIPYVYNPRIANELLTPYKAYLRKAVGKDLGNKLRQSPIEVYNWCLYNIHIDDTHNVLGYATSPSGVWRSRVADRHSVAIFFVALSRAMGWAARIDAITGKAQYFDRGQWIDVPLGKTECIRYNQQTKSRERYSRGKWESIVSSESKENVIQSKGLLRLSYVSNGIVDNPKYYNQFTISQLNPAGQWHLLSYDVSDKGLEQGATWGSTFASGTPIDSGFYSLTSGSRLANGSVLVNMKMFAVKPQEHKTIELVMRRDTTQVAVLGSFDSESLYDYLGKASELTTSKALMTAIPKTKSLLATTGRGYYVLGILGAGAEPTNHALRDIAAVQTDLERWGRGMVLVFSDEVSRNKFRPEDFPNLPSTAVYGIDRGGGLLNQILKEMKLPNNNLPVFIIADTFNRIVFVSQGYTIGLGEQLRRVISGLD